MTADRIDKIEWILNNQETRIEELEDSREDVFVALRNVNNTLLQIKYFIVGSLCMFVLSELGLLKTIETILR